MLAVVEGVDGHWRSVAELALAEVGGTRLALQIVDVDESLTFRLDQARSGIADASLSAENDEFVCGDAVIANCTPVGCGVGTNLDQSGSDAGSSHVGGDVEDADLKCGSDGRGGVVGDAVDLHLVLECAGRSLEHVVLEIIASHSPRGGWGKIGEGEGDGIPTSSSIVDGGLNQDARRIEEEPVSDELLKSRSVGHCGDSVHDGRSSNAILSRTINAKSVVRLAVGTDRT